MTATPALVDHVYGPGQVGQIHLPRFKEDHFKWTEEETRKFLELRRKYIDRFFLGKRGSIQQTYAIILEEMGLLGKVTPSQARKKWNNMAQLYRRLVSQPRYDAGDGKEFSPLISWPFFRDVEKTIELEPPRPASPECSPFEGTNLEDFSEQINARFVQVAFPSTMDPEEDDHESSDEAPPPKRIKAEKEDLLAMIHELNKLNRKQEEILAAKNKITITLLSQLV